MTQPYELIDETADEREDRELTAALFEEFAADRPDPEEFAAGVRAKVEQPTAQVKPMPGYLRAAAAMLPPFLLPKPLTAGIGGAVAGKGIAKLVPGVAAFPVAILVVLLLTLFASLRVMFRPVVGAPDGAVDTKEVDRQLREWWREHLFGVVAVCIGLFLLFIYAQAEAVALLLVGSTATLFLIWSRLSAFGFLTRAEVGRRAAGVLSIVAANSIGIVFHLRDEQAGVAWIPSLLFVAMFVCLGLAGKSARRLVVAGLFVGVALPAVLVTDAFGSFGKVPVVVADVRAGLARPSTAVEWGLPTVARCVRNLRGAAVAVPSLEPLREHVQEHRRVNLAGQRFDHDSLAILELGFAMPWDYAYWRNEYREKQVLAGEPVDGSRGQRTALSLLAAGRLDAPQRLAIAREIVDRDGPVHGVDRFAELSDEIRFVEALGHAELVPGFAARGRRLLIDRWLLADEGQRGVFSSFRQDDEEAPGRRIERASFVWLDSTSLAVDLMARFGVPEVVDLVALGRYLDHERYRWARRGPSRYNADAVCALARLEAMPEYRAALAAEPAPGLVAVLLEWRVFGAALLLAGFAIAATLRAPRAVS
ncbi:MAG: hypothetical protein NXI31_24810 [bacterium]|nr:hypothetical protein [bacterium]